MNKKITLSVFVLASSLLVIGLLVQVVNPHSFLGTGGAFITSLIILAGAIIWLYLAKKYSYTFLLFGSVFFLFGAASYFYYGVDSFCQNTDYEKTKNSNIDIEYNCTQIIKDSIFK